jgi:hypothetical protein
MDTSKIEYDNEAVSKMPPQWYKGIILIHLYVIFLATIITIVMLVSINTTTNDDILLEMSIILIIWIWVIFFFVAAKYRIMESNKICFQNEEMTVINKKRYKVKYQNIGFIEFSIHSYDRNGNPCIRWIIEWKKGLLPRLFSLTDENAKILAKQLEGNDIHIVWDDHHREEWRNRVKKSKLNDTPE